MVVQISIFLPNRPKQLVKVTDALMKAEVNIRALTISETADFGLLRIIVSDPEKAKKALQGEFLVEETDVIAVQLVDKPGGLNDIAKALGNAEINIEYMYAFLGKGEQAVLILRVENKMRSKAIDVLEGKNMKIFSSDEIYSL